MVKTQDTSASTKLRPTGWTRSWILAGLCVLAAPMAQAHPAIKAFTSVCFNAGQTAVQARGNMERVVGRPLPFALTFWDTTLEPAADAPAVIERRCEVEWLGADTQTAIAALRAKMAQKPVFGFRIALPGTHAPLPGTALIEGRELLRGRVAVVHVGTRIRGAGTHSFMAVDRLPEGWEALVK